MVNNLFRVLLLTVLCFFSYNHIIHKTLETLIRERCEIIDLKKFESAVLIKAKNIITNEIILIISENDGNFDKNKNHDTIRIGGVYDFELSYYTKIRGYQMGELEFLIIIKKDTVWKGKAYDKIPYKSANSNGMFIYKE